MVTGLVVAGIFWFKATLVDVGNILFITSIKDKFSKNKQNKQYVKWENI